MNKLKPEETLKRYPPPSKEGMQEIIDSCDVNIIVPLRKLIEKGFITLSSCSGVSTEHKAETGKPLESYIIVLSENDRKAQLIKKAAQISGLTIAEREYKPTWHRSSWYPGIDISFQASTDKEVKEKWAEFDKHLSRLLEEEK